MGFKVNEKEAPETVKPLPATVAEFMVTAAPVEVKVIDCVAVVPTFTSPKLTAEALMVSTGVPVFKLRMKVADTPTALAVRVTVCAELTEETVAVKLALVAPTGTVTEAGSVTALLLLAMLIATPPEAAAAFKITEQLSVPVPVIKTLAQLSVVRTGSSDVPGPVEDDEPLDELKLDPAQADRKGSKQRSSTTEMLIRQLSLCLLVPLS